MNIFVLDENPSIAAKAHCDKHVVKMIVESAQMLSTAHRMLDGNECRRPSKSGKTMSRYWTLPDDRETHMYRAVHMHHPCTKWTMETSGNYDWHFMLYMALCNEYQVRYGKIHKTDSCLSEALCELPHHIKAAPRTQWAMAMKANPECMDPSDAVKSYRDFYKTKRTRFNMAWTNRPTPNWFNDK